MSTRDIGVITPYTGQVTYLKSMFDHSGGIAKGQKYHKLTIHSVDGFQGCLNLIEYLIAFRERKGSNSI
jgi:superfamily I DNA and/or RNA helicase